MGGQACILYGAAEFSRDIDVAVLADPENLGRLQQALEALQAEPVFVPPLSREVLPRLSLSYTHSRGPGIATGCDGGSSWLRSVSGTLATAPRDYVAQGWPHPGHVPTRSRPDQEDPAKIGLWSDVWWKPIFTSVHVGRLDSKLNSG
jgi:hypothetical protein